MIQIILDALLDGIIDTAKLLPFLFLTYLAMEYLEHRTEEKTRNVVEKAGKMGPLFGGLLGAVPQCGFSAAASTLYSGRVITLGTLISIYLSTSDEMLPIFLSSDKASILLIVQVLVCKAVIGIIMGFSIDAVYHIVVLRGWFKPRRIIPATSPKAVLDEEPGTEHIKDICEQEACNCEKGILSSGLIHTVQVAGFILLISFILNLLMELGGADALAGFLSGRPVIGPILAGLVGLIPNCAASVVIAQLYLEGILGFGGMLSGLLVGAGVGLLVLFRTNHSAKQNIIICSMLYTIGVFWGIISELLFTLFSGLL